MKINYPKVRVSGVQPSQQYVGVSSGTAVYASTRDVRITGVPEQAVLVEVRKAPSKSFEVQEESGSEAALNSASPGTVTTLPRL